MHVTISMYRGGRGRGNRMWPGNGPFSNLPPWQRPGWVYGGGYNVAGYDPSTCRRFPWLPRWWWANPEYTNPYPAPSAGGQVQQPYWPPYQGEMPIEQEREYLETIVQDMENQLESINKRLQELEE
jgi:hypothetical protein